MKVTYFPDTDTLLVVFSDREVADTRDLDENTLVEIDREGRVVSLTIEHARQLTDVNAFSYEFSSPAAGRT